MRLGKRRKGKFCLLVAHLDHLIFTLLPVTVQWSWAVPPSGTVMLGRRPVILSSPRPEEKSSLAASQCHAAPGSRSIPSWEKSNMRYDELGAPGPWNSMFGAMVLLLWGMWISWGLWPKKGQVAEASKSFFVQLDTRTSHAQKNHLLSCSCSYTHSTPVSQKQGPEGRSCCAISPSSQLPGAPWSVDTHTSPLGKTTHSSLALKPPVKHQVWSQEAWPDKKPTLPSPPCFLLVCAHVCVYRRATRTSTRPVPRGRNRTWRWSWSRPFEAMQVKKPTSSELTRLITRAPSDCCLCLGNKTRKPLSLCLGQDGTPATTDEPEPRAQLCSNTEQRFSSSSVQPVMQPLVLKSQHYCCRLWKSSLQEVSGSREGAAGEQHQ